MAQPGTEQMADIARVDQVESVAGALPQAVEAVKIRKPFPSWAITGLSIVALVSLWEFVGHNVNPIFGSSPSAIAIAFWNLVRSGELLAAVVQSLRAFVVGYLLAVSIGVPLGLFLGRSRVLEAALGFLVIGGYAMPLVALVPLLVLWLGLGFAVKAAVVFLMAVFPVVINTWLGVRAVPNSLIEVGKSFVASDFTILRRILLPATIPYIMAGIKLAIGRAVVAMVIAEFFTAISGLGGIVINAANNFDTATMFVPVIVLMVLATALNALVGWVEKKVAPWQSEIAGRNR